jgi:hypothetical protein
MKRRPPLGQVGQLSSGILPFVSSGDIKKEEGTLPLENVYGWGGWI